MNSRIIRLIVMLFFLSVLSLLVLYGCSSYKSDAPVKDVTLSRVGNHLIHRVVFGETLYSIAWYYNRDYRDLALINRLKPPYTIKAGQIIYLNKTTKSYRITKKQFHKECLRKKKLVRHWVSPAMGHVIRGFSYENRGIDISGRYGAPIYAVERGTVVYAGNGIRGYGNLIVIKHNGNYLTAYAYNKRMLVRTNQYVVRGEKIATMGKTDQGKVMLHFEIRLKGKPVNPKYYIHVAF